MTDTEKAVLEARIDELCAENEKLRKKADMLQWNSDCFIKIYGSWKRLRATVPHLERENAKLRELAARMARALGVGHWCSADCGREFGCDWTPEGCPIANAMRELGVDE